MRSIQPSGPASGSASAPRQASDPAAPPAFASDGTASDPVIEAIIGDLRSALRELRCATSERIIRQGLSMTQFHVLWLLQHHGDLAMSRLAELLAVSLSNASGLVDRMEERELVERRRVRDDRRLVVVGIGPEGQRLLRELEILNQDRFDQALATLEPARLERMRQAFADFRAAIESDAGSQRHSHATDPAETPGPDAAVATSARS